ncbi:hypothetical protein ABH930_001605 [Kitasatospora sp. GAS204A]
MPSPGIGSRTELESTKAITPPSVNAAAAARASRSAPRKTVSKESRQSWSSVPSTDPAGGPPTLIRMPSRRPKRVTAVVTIRSAASASALSPTRPTAAGSPPRESTAASRLCC